MKIEEIRKAVAALLTAVAGFAALFGFNPEWVGVETISAAAGIVAAIVGAVWAVPNKIAGENVVDRAKRAP